MCSESQLFIVVFLEGVLRAVESITTSWERVTDYGSKVGSLKLRQLLYVQSIFYITLILRIRGREEQLERLHGRERRGDMEIRIFFRVRNQPTTYTSFIFFLKVSTEARRSRASASRPCFGAHASLEDALAHIVDVADIQILRCSKEPSCVELY